MIGNGRMDNLAKIKLPLTPPKLLKIHQLGCIKTAKNTAKESMQKGVRMILNNKLKL